MNEEQMKGYLAYWDDDSYPEIWDLPRVYNPMTCLYNKFNKDWQLGWAVASNENQHGEYQEYEISEATGGIIHKKGLSPEENQFLKKITTESDRDNHELRLQRIGLGLAPRKSEGEAHQAL